MKAIVQITYSAALVAGLIGLSHAAFATDTREAIKMCDKNPKCKLTDIGSGFISVSVPGGTVMCPMVNGPCQARTTPKHLGHAGENGNDRSKGGNDGNSDGGGQVGGPS